MKNFKNIAYILFVLYAFSSCIDDGARPLIDFTPFVPVDDTTYIDLDTLSKATPQTKNVLIEDFTGVKCSNCPDAAKKIKEIKEKNPGRVISLALHTGPDGFTHPKKDHSTYDFRTEDGDRIATMLSASGNLPEGTVERVLYESEETIITNRFVWSGHADMRLLESSPLNIDVNVLRHDADSIIFLVRVFYHSEGGSQPNFLNVYLSEDGLVDYQYDIFIGDIEDYEHEHVFRKNLTSTQGDSLVVSGVSMPYIEGRVFQRRFVVPVKKDTPDEEYRTGWNYENLNVVAFVSKRNAEDYEVIHVIEKHLGE